LLFAALGNGESFKNGRAASVYAGVTPMQYSSGGKSVLLGITKQGDATLRAAMFQGALSVISRLKPQATTQKHQWLLDLVKRAGIKRACIALVNKNIRTAWAMLKNKTEYNPVYL
jgi:transposase